MSHSHLPALGKPTGLTQGSVVIRGRGGDRAEHHKMIHRMKQMVGVMILVERMMAQNRRYMGITGKKGR